MADPYRCFRIEVEEGVATLSLAHPPINLLDAALIGELDRAGRELEANPDVRVVVIRSEDPDFFIAHADVELIQQMPLEAERPRGLLFFHAAMERFRTLPKVTIAKIEGRARGGGSEFLLSLDLRFGAIGRCIISQPEVALGIIPGGGGTQRLPRLMGRARALEAVLACEDFDALLAERYGWINRALPAAEIADFVDRLARRVASFPPEAVALAKRAVDAAHLPLEAGLLEEARCFQQALATDAARESMAAFLESGGQTREVELELGSRIARDAE